MTTTTGYDIIGDIHGCAGKLIDLLNAMGYAEVNGAWKHPTRQAVFVGDFIDRGPNQLESVRIPKTMVEAGNALAVIGNHEFNAIAYATKNYQGKWCRAHSERNQEQSAVFLEAAPLGSPIHKEIMEWSMTLPLWLDLDGVRVVHACWHEASMEVLRPSLSEIGSLTNELIIKASVPDSAEYDSIEKVEGETRPSPGRVGDH